jgi:hypothetical protein
MGIENNIARFGVGFVGDILLDPSTYVGGALVRGALTGTKLAAKGGIKMLGKFSPELEQTINVSAQAIKEASGELFVHGYGTTKGLPDDMLTYVDKKSKVLKGLAESNMKRLGTGVLNEDQAMEFVAKQFSGKNAELDFIEQTEKDMIEAFNKKYPNAKFPLEDVPGALRRMENLAIAVPKKISRLQELRQRLAQPFIADDLLGLKDTVAQLKSEIADLAEEGAEEAVKKAKGKEFMATDAQANAALLSALSTEKQKYREMIAGLMLKLEQMEKGIVDPAMNQVQKKIATDSARYNVDEIMQMVMRGLDPKLMIKDRITELDRLIRTTQNDMFSKQSILERVLESKSIAKKKIADAFASGDFSTLPEELVLALKPAIKAAGFGTIKVAGNKIVKGSLIDEARKYKTAEEFVDGLNKNYNFIDEFGGKTNIEIDGNTAKIYGIYSKKPGTKLYERVVDDLKNRGVKNVNIELQSADSRGAIDSLIKKGILKNPSGGDSKILGGGRPTLFEISGAKTKSQLTDIWKEAQKSTYFASEARSYKTADEFISANDIDNNLEEVYNKIYGKNTDQFGQPSNTLGGTEVGGTVRGGKAGNLGKDRQPNIGGIVKHINENPDGFTLRLDGKPVPSGFVVSPYKGREMIVSKVNAASVKTFIDKNIDLLSQEGNHFGGWRNPKDGKFYLDVSVVKDVLEDGIGVAARNSQLAIYDIAKGESIFTKDFLKSKLTDIWSKAKETKAMNIGAISDDQVVEDALLNQIKRNAETARKTHIEDPFRMYFPSLDKTRLKDFMYKTRTLRIGSEGWRKEYKNLIKEEDLLRNPAQAYFKVESEAAVNNLNRSTMENVVKDYGLPVNAFRNEKEATAAGYKMWRERGTIMGKEIGWLKDQDWKFVNGQIGDTFGAIDTLAKATGFDAATSLFKRFVTGLFAPFHVRNYVSGLIQNYEVIGGEALNPATIALGQRIAHKMSQGAFRGFGEDRAIARSIKKQVKSFGNETVELGGKTWYLDDITQAVEKRFGGSSRYVADYNSITNDAKILQTGEAFSKDSMASFGKKMIDHKKPIWSQMDALTSQDSPHFKAAQVIGGFIETQQKASMVVAALKKGMSLDDALKMAEKAGFDYRALTPFESHIMRRIIPFYSFNRKNIELQLSALKQHPERINATIRSIDNLRSLWEEELTDEEKENLPAYLREYLSVPVGRSDKTGNPQFIRTFGTPIEAFTSLVKGSAEGKSSVERTFLGTLSQVNPYIKVPVEFGIGKDSFRQRDIKEVYTAVEYQDAPQFLKDYLRLKEVTKKSATGQTYTQYVADPERLAVVRALPTSRGFTYVNNIFNGDVEGFFKIMDALSGIKTTEVDPERQAGYTERQRQEALGDLLRRYGIVSEFNKLFIPSDKKK